MRRYGSQLEILPLCVETEGYRRKRVRGNKKGGLTEEKYIVHDYVYIMRERLPRVISERAETERAEAVLKTSLANLRGKHTKRSMDPQISKHGISLLSPGTLGW